MGELLRGPFCSNPKQSPGRSAGVQETHRLWWLIWSHCPAVGWRRLEQLCRSLRQSPTGISQRLLKLELAGLVRSAPGLWWHPC